MKQKDKIKTWAEINSNGNSTDRMNAFLNSRDDVYVILQLNREAVGERFLSWDALHRRGLEPNMDHYEAIYVAPLSSFPDLAEMLEGLYAKFNTAHPADYCGRSMSVSNVVALKQSGVMSFHYVDSIGFREIRNFMKEAPHETAQRKSFSEQLARGQEAAQTENIPREQSLPIKINEQQR